MPRRNMRDENVAARIRQALDGVAEGRPTNAVLITRAEKGTLKVSVTTVSHEAGIKRHVLDDEAGPYAAERALVVARAEPKGTVAPLRHQLDGARREIAELQTQLARSRTMSAHVVLRMRNLEAQVRALTAELATARAGNDNGTDGVVAGVIGSGPAAFLPAGARNGGRASRRGGTRRS